MSLHLQKQSFQEFILQFLAFLPVPSIASYETGGSVQDVSNYSVPRFLTSKFGKGLYIEEGITNYLYNSSFEYYDEPSEVPYYWLEGQV